MVFIIDSHLMRQCMFELYLGCFILDKPFWYSVHFVLKKAYICIMVLDLLFDEFMYYL